MNFTRHPRVTKLFCIDSPLNRSQRRTYCIFQKLFSLHLLFRVEEQLSGKELLKQVQRKEDVVKEKYIVCSRSNDLHRSFGKRLVIARDSRDPFYCNGPSECKSKADEPCPYVTIHSSSSFSGSINISREHLEGMKNDQGTKSLRRRGRDRSTSTVYIVTGTYGFWDGVYQEESSPVRHYRMMGASSGYTKFLYTDVDEPSCWMIGHGEDISSAFAVFRGHSDLGGCCHTLPSSLPKS